MKLTQNPAILDIDPFNVNSNLNLMTPGAFGFDVLGRKYRYINVGAVALVKGNLIQGIAVDTNNVDMAVQAAAAVSQNQISVTLGGSSWTANQFANGFLTVSVTPGLGQNFVIKTHPAATNGTTCLITAYENVLTALTTSSKVSVVANPFTGAIQNPTTRTGRILGVALAAIPISNAGWVGCEGTFGVLSDATVPLVNGGVSPSTTTAGCITKAVTLVDRIGTAYVQGVSAQVEPIDLRIP